MAAAGQTSLPTHSAFGMQELSEDLSSRNRLFETLNQRYDTGLSVKPRESITVSLDLGAGNIISLSATSWSTTPAQLIKQNTKQVAAFKVMGNSAAYFLGDQSNGSLQRISGVALPNSAMMRDWEALLSAAKERDHQEIGRDQKLFWVTPLSPGSPFLLTNSTRIFNAIQEMLREQYWERSYEEIQSPLMCDVDLWRQSGHWRRYRDSVFHVPMKHQRSSEPANAHSESGHDEDPAAAVETEGRADGSLPRGLASPVMLHRAVIGSFERFMVVITEHFAGKCPFWLSPRQIVVKPIMKEAEDYANEVRAELRKFQFYVDVDNSGDTPQKKVRNAQVAQYDFIMLVGAQEREA